MSGSCNSIECSLRWGHSFTHPFNTLSALINSERPALVGMTPRGVANAFVDMFQRFSVRP